MRTINRNGSKQKRDAAVLPNGYTLIELIIYIALLSGILTAALIIAHPIITGAERLSRRVGSDLETTFVLQKISLAVTGAASSDITVPLPGAESDVLIVNGVSFTTIGGAVTADSAPLTASRSSFADFSVTYAVGSANHLDVAFTVDGVSVGPVRFMLSNI